MTAPAGRPPGPPELPGRALLVAPTIERAAVLGTAFDDAMAVTLSDISLALTTEGHDVPCVAVAGIPTRGGRLAAVIAQVLESCRPDVQVVVDISNPLGADPALAEALRGLALVDRVELAGLRCLRFVRATNAGDVPDLTPARPNVGDAADAAEMLATTVGADWAARVQALETELAETKAALAAVSGQRSEPAPGPRRGTPAALVRRLRGAGAPAALLAFVLVGATLILTFATDVQYADAAVTGLLAVALLQFGYSWRCDRRTRAALGRVGSAVRADADAAAERGKELSARVAGIEKNLAVATASAIDTARAVARLRERASDAANDDGGHG